MVLSMFCVFNNSYSQGASLRGIVHALSGEKLGFTNVSLEGTTIGTSADENGRYKFSQIPPGKYTIITSFLGYETGQKLVTLKQGDTLTVNFTLKKRDNAMEEIVVTGTLKEVNRLESSVPVEVYNPSFFKKNPTPNIYEALQNVNGVRPQLNCQICNTGDIHINGLEGAYTMVLLDGMPIVSSLSTVYGLSGIPNSLIERVEIVKGPASSLYGSEAVAGLINIITKNPEDAPILSLDIMGTTWAELNADVGVRFNLGKKISALTGVNYFNYDHPIDNNGDNFTDLTIQKRVSIFQKLNFKRKNSRLFSLAARYYSEERWGGELNWTETFRGSDTIYGEAITTKRWEFLAQYRLPTVDNMVLSLSFNSHNQNSDYGNTPYIAEQKIGFAQITWDKKINTHDLLLGTAFRYTYYDDNTFATLDVDNPQKNNPSEILLPSIFIQDEITLTEKQKILLGLRYDYNNAHGNIFTPRFAYKWSVTPTDILRLNAGTGFRVVNLFTEDHAALTGAREVVIVEKLAPEQSYNVNANYIKRVYLENGVYGSLELSSWYTYFTNIILPDYETNANQIIYDNLDGNAISKGVSINADCTFPNGLSFFLGSSLLDVSKEENGIKKQQLLTEGFTGTWSISYTFFEKKMTVDYTGNIYGPMRLPLLGERDPRPEKSPWWSIQNIQLTYQTLKGFEFYTGVKNILNWTPWKNQSEPIIARAFDPFDKDVEYDAAGNVKSTPNNPNALTFDPTYVYAPNQGIRYFFGIRYFLK